MKCINEARSQNDKSVVALALLLEKIVTDAAMFVDDKGLMIALKRQDRLAKYSRPQMGVHPTSRSTVERCAERLFEGGFPYLDGLRRAALEALNHATIEASRAPRRTRQRISEDLKDEQRLRVQALVDCCHVTDAFRKALKEGRALANLSRSGELVAWWDKKEAELLAMFRLAKRPVVRTNSEAEEWLRKLRW